MDRATLLVIELLSLLVVVSASNGTFSTQNSSNAIAATTTGQNRGTTVHFHLFLAWGLCACVQTYLVIREIMYSRYQVLTKRSGFISTILLYNVST